MVRLLVWLSFILVAVGCTEDLTSPGPCPDFCPPVQILVVDTVISASIARDSSYRGYVLTHRSRALQVATGGAAESHAIIRFSDFDEEVFLDTTNTIPRPILSVDSFAVNFVIDSRTTEAGDLDFAVHRLPVTIDSTTAFADLQSIFSDSASVASFTVASADTTDTLSVILPGDAFPTLEEDSSVSAIGISLESLRPAFLNIQARDRSINSIWITRFVQVDSSEGVAAARSDTTYTTFDSYVYSDLPPAAAGATPVGGAPSARAFLTLSLPSYVVDSSSVVRATLLLVPAEPVVGPPGDSIRILAERLAADIGAKSPVVQVPDDSISFFSGVAVAGSSDTLRIDVTHIVAPLKDNPELSRTFMLRAVRESEGYGEFRFVSSAGAAGVPALHVTYVPPPAIGN